MLPTPSALVSSDRYSRQAVQRAQRAIACSPFRLPLFVTMREQGVALSAIASSEGVRNGYTQRRLSEIAAENELLWLIQVGLLRREVDGQGLTDSFRLTPLGRQLLEPWQQSGALPRSSWLDHLHNLYTRWLRLPDWLSSWLAPNSGGRRVPLLGAGSNDEKRP